MHFEFATATRIIFGAGGLNTIDTLTAPYGRHALIISGAPDEHKDRLTNLLKSRMYTYSLVEIHQEPTIELVRKMVDIARESSCEFVIGIGGGSTIDAGKAVSAMLTNPGDLTEYLEVIGLNRPLVIPSTPFIAIPTTSGTGSEVTRNAVIGSTEHCVKVSLRSPYLLPRIALVDPELTISVPPFVTAFTGMDALTQLIEPFTCNNSNPLTDAICREGMALVARSIIKAYNDGADLTAREDMSLASLFGGLALANAKLGAVHGMAGPIGGELSAPHGAICARLLPIVMMENIKALRIRSPINPILKRYDEVGKILTGNPSATADDGIHWVQNVCTLFNIQPLTSLGLSENSFHELIAKSVKASSMKGNPITLTDEEINNILQQSL
jgi:alcohol dehydrogenase class IV